MKNHLIIDLVIILPLFIGSALTAEHSNSDVREGDLSATCSGGGAGVVSSSPTLIKSATWTSEEVRHEYRLYSDSAVPWDVARTWISENLAGYYLASVTDSAENCFVNAFIFADISGPYWLGGYQNPTSTQQANANWTWITGEAWSYTNWSSGEPNDWYGVGSEQCLTGNWLIGKMWNDEGYLGGISGFVAERTVLVINFDIKPGSCPSPFNGTDQTRGKAVLSAAIVGTTDVDVHDIDPSTITLNGVSPIRWSYEDVSSPVDKSDDSCACTEQGPDGILDLTFKFDRNAIEATLLTPPNRSNLASAAGNGTPDEQGEVVVADETRSEPMSRDTRIVIIRGQLIDGTPIEGYDCVLFMTKNGATATLIEQPSIELGLGNNHPNPFNPTTIIEYSLPTATPVTIEVFNLLGQKVKTLVDETRPAGRHQVEWNGTDDGGKSVSTGVYVYRIQAGDFEETKKMMLLK